MKLLRAVLICFIMSGSAFGATFFGELEQAYLKAFEEIVRVTGTNAFSICLEAKPRPLPSPFQALPSGFWDKLRPRLEAKGLTVSTYLPPEELKWGPYNQVVVKASGRPASIYVIERLQWGGNGRLLVTWARRVWPLAEEGSTLVLELKDGRWVVAGITGGWVS